MAEAMLILARRIASEALQTVNRAAQAAYARDPGGNARWNFGVYLFSEDEASRPPTGEPGDGPPADATRGDAP